MQRETVVREQELKKYRQGQGEHAVHELKAPTTSSSFQSYLPKQQRVTRPVVVPVVVPARQQLPAPLCGTQLQGSQLIALRAWHVTPTVPSTGAPQSQQELGGDQPRRAEVVTQPRELVQRRQRRTSLGMVGRGLL